MSSGLQNEGKTISCKIACHISCSVRQGYAQQHHAVGGVQIPPDSKKFSFYVIETPLTIVLPGDQRLVRLRLILSLDSTRHEER
jgi:hypothetical protein